MKLFELWFVQRGSRDLAFLLAPLRGKVDWKSAPRVDSIVSVIDLFGLAHGPNYNTIIISHLQTNGCQYRNVIKSEIMYTNTLQRTHYVTNYVYVPM